MDEEENEDEIEDKKTKSKADSEKMKRVKAKMEKFMIEVGMDLLDDETYGHAKKKILSVLKSEGLPTTLSYIKAFREGFQTAMGAQGVDASFATMIVCAVTKMVTEMSVDTNKMVDSSMKNITGK